MTAAERIELIKMKNEGRKYREMAIELNISESAIKSFFKRNKNNCPICGALVEGRKFCSDKCRSAWWRKHSHKTIGMLEYSCISCGKKFYAFPSKQRKYCSKQCYGKACRKDKNDK
ncbi:MAG: hypothetical protein J6X56_10810 [Ruminococcus sp.]|nr:hypothetical protein [Ruminococcus sp.]